MNAELRLNEIADRADTETECHTFKFRHHLAPAEIAEVSAGRSGRILGELFGESAEVFALLCALEYLPGLILDLLDFFGSLFLSLEKNVLCFHAFRQHVFRFVLVVILPQFVIGDLHFRPEFQGLEENVFRLAFFVDRVLGFVLLVVLARLRIGRCYFAFQFRGIDHKIVDFSLFVAALIFLFGILIVDVNCRRDEASKLVGQDFIRNIRLELIDREVVLGQERLVPVAADEGAVFTKNGVFQDPLLDFPRRNVQTETFSLFGHDVARHQGIHDLPLETEGAQHFRVDLAPHPVDIVPVRRLKLVRTDAVAADGSYVARDAYVREVAEWNIKGDQSDAKYEDQDHPDPLQRRALTPHEIQHRRVLLRPGINSIMLTEIFRSNFAFHV